MKVYGNRHINTAGIKVMGASKHQSNVVKKQNAFHALRKKNEAWLSTQEVIDEIMARAGVEDVDFLSPKELDDIINQVKVYYLDPQEGFIDEQQSAVDITNVIEEAKQEILDAKATDPTEDRGTSIMDWL